MANKYKKFVASAATATLVASAIVPVASANETVKFSDVKDSSEYAQYIYDLSEKKVMTGNGDKFNPSGEVTRTAAVKTLGKWLVNVHGYEIPADWNTKARFNDVAVDSKDEELVKYAALLKDLGIFTGNEAGNLNAKNTLNREQMAKVVVEAYSVIEGVKVVDLVADFESSLKDLSSVSPGNVDYVKVFEKYGITTVDTFNPKGKMQRQHFAKFLSISINSEALAKDTATLADPVVAALTAVEKAVKALPKVEEVTVETAEAATKAVEAVTTAVEAATKVIADAELTAEEKTAAEKTLADATAAAKLVADKVAALTATIEVEEVTASNETSVQVKIASKVTEEDLTGKQLTLTSGETVVTATYVAGSLTANGQAVFQLDAEAKLVDTKTYATTADWAKISKGEFVAKVATAYVKEFKQVTTGIPANTKEDTANRVVTFETFDQYGEEIAAPATIKTVKVTLNGLTANAVYADGKVTIKETLAEGDKVVITLKHTTGTGTNEVTLAEKTVDFVVVKAAEAKVSSVSIKAAKESIPAQGNTELTVKLADQFNNALSLGTNFSEVRFQVNGEPITSVPESEAEGLYTVGGKLYFKSSEPGTYKIEAFAKADTKVKSEVTVTVGAANLTSLTVEKTGDLITDAAKRYNNEEIVVATIKPNTGAVLKASDLKFDVKGSNGLKAEDVTVTADVKTVGTGADAKEVVVIKAKTTKKGTFTVVPFIGEKVNADNAITADSIEFTTEYNPTVKTATIEAIKANEITAGSTITKEIVLKNEYNEVIGLPAAKSVVSSNEAVATATLKNVNNKNVLEIDAKVAGKTTLTVVTGAVSQQVAIEVVKEAELTTVSLGNAISKGVFAKDTKETTQVVDVKDQYGNAFIPANITDITLSTSKEITGFAKLAYYTTNAKGEVVVSAETTAAAVDNVKGLVLVINAEQATNTVNETIKVTAKKGEKELSTVNVTIQPAKVLNKVTVSAAATTLTAGATTTVRVVPTNQYNEVLAGLVKGDFSTTSEVYSIEEVKEVKEKEKTVGYDVVVKAVDGAKVEKSTVDITVTKEVAKTANIDLTVVNALDEVKSIEIKPTTGLQYASESGDGVQLETVIKGSDNKVIEVADSELEWTVTGVKDASGKELKLTDNGDGTYEVTYGSVGSEKTATITLENGVLKTTGLDGFIIDVAVKVESKNNTSATATVKVDDSVKKYTSGFAIAEVNGEKLEVATTSFEIADKDSKAITFTFTGIDQYGEDFDITEGVTATASGDLKVSYGSGSSAGELIITADADSVDGKVYIRYGNERLTLDVKIADVVKEALKASN